jgi:hypothetical protein
MSFRYKKIWVLFFISKLAYTFLALAVYSRFTTLGDSAAYIASSHSKVNWFINSTAIMDYTASSASFFFGDYGTHIFFCILAFYGIYTSLEKANLNKRNLYLTLVFLSLPSIGIWTSIVSKEAILCFACGIFIRFLIQVHREEPIDKLIGLTIAIYIIGIFKPQYLAVFIPILLFVKYKNTYFRSISAKIIILLSYVVTIISLAVIYNELIQQTALIVSSHFNPDAASTRDEALWKEPYDFFTKLPYGFYISFVGPTFAEATNKITHLMSFIESWIIILIGIRFYLYSFLERLKNLRLDINILLISVVIYFGFMFFHYPFGVMNPGSAIRYRAGFLPAMFIMLMYFNYHRSKKVRIS